MLVIMIAKYWLGYFYCWLITTNTTHATNGTTRNVTTHSWQFNTISSHTTADELWKEPLQSFQQTGPKDFIFQIHIMEVTYHTDRFGVVWE